MVRMQILLDSEEADLIAKWAAVEFRDPREHIHYIIRKVLIERGLLHTEPSDESSHDSSNLKNNF